MTPREPTAVVVPFGVPNDRRGLGLGLAALVHGFARIRNEPVALAQILGKHGESAGDAPMGPVEAFISPATWRDMTAQGTAPADVKFVVTGSFEPPDGGAGALKLLAFDGSDGTVRAQADVHVDTERAGEAIVDAIEKVCHGFGAETGELRVLRDLPWEALESVLRAERCVLHDPQRGGPHDRLAAMLHLGRAVEEAPGSRYAAGRLAVVALDAALGPAADPKIADAAVRAVMRAAVDAPDQPDLLEAAGALHVRLGHSLEAEATVLGALARDPSRPRLYAILSEARRVRGDTEGALRAVTDGLARAPHDPFLGVEHGTVLALIGDLAGADRALRAVLNRQPLFPPAYASLAQVAARRADAVTAQMLVDQALAASHPHPEVLRCALRLAFSAESEGVARAARIATLARALLALTPADAGALVALAQALALTGETREAIASYARAEAMAKGTPIAAEAQRARFTLAEPLASQEIESVLRAAAEEPHGSRALLALSMRARRIAADHATWTAWLALGVVERRRGAWASAREALVTALSASEGSAATHAELAHACVALGDGETATRHAERAVALEGESARALGALAEARIASGNRAEGEALLARAKTLAPEDADLLALEATLRSRSNPPTAMTRAKDAFARLTRR